MKSLLYLCRRYKVATLLTLFGLGVSVAAFYLFMTQVVYNSTYNHCVPCHERTYRLEMKISDWQPLVCRPIEQLLTGVPHIQKVQSTDICYRPNTQEVSVGQRKMSVRLCNASQPGPEFFGTRMICGSVKDWVTSNTAIITRSAALRLFGTEEAVGKQYTRPLNQDNGTMTVTVVGVCEDLPDNCTFAYDVYECLGNENLTNGSEWSYRVYVRLDANADAAKVAHDIKLQVMKAFGTDDEKTYDEQVGIAVRLSPIDDTYFSGISPDDRGNHNLVGVLGVSAAVIMLFALLNLLNFTLSVVPMRIRGLNTRRVMGASVASLRLGMVLENAVVGIIGIAIGAVLVLAFMHSAPCMQLVSGSIAFADHPWLVAATVGVALLTGVLSAIIPAWYSTSFTPALVLKGSFGLSPRGRRLRMAIMMVQFCAAFVLAVYVGVMTLQARYIFHSDYGFNKDEVFFASLSTDAMGKKEALRAELKRLPFVTHVGFAQSVIGSTDSYMTWTRGGDGIHKVTYAALPCDAEYLQTIGVKIAQGRALQESDKSSGAYVVNQTMMKTCNWTRLGEKLFPCDTESSQNYTIVGVCENFRLYTVRKDNANTCAAFLIAGPDMESWGDNCGRIFVRVAKGYDKIEAKRKIAETLSSVDASTSYEVQFLDDCLQDTYTEEFRFITQVKTFALISIVITLIGVFCLTLFETEYRRKEMAIRKVMGGTVGQVIGLFTARYILPLVISFAVAVPLAIYLSRQWLQTFTEHTTIAWWLFPLALLLVSAVVLLTVTAQCWRVATSNPVESIKTE